MGFLDLVFLIFGNLGRRKARVALTAIGVIIGTAAIVVLVSLGIGLQRNAAQQLTGMGDLTQIQVMPNYGDGGMVKGGMAVSVGGGGGGVPSTTKLITNDSLTELAGVPGVVAVIPRDWLMGPAMIKYNQLEAGMGVVGMGVKDLSELGMKASAGSLVLEKGSMVIGAMIPKNFYDPHQRPGQPMPEPPNLLDQTVKLVLIKYDQEGKEIRKTVSMRVAGIIAESSGESDYSMYISLDEMNTFNEWMTGRRINRHRDGYNQVVVKVDDIKNVLDAVETIKTLGYQAYTPQTYVQGVNGFYVVLQVIFGGVGAISLLVAAIGIANTMAMAILERTREIGLMKAIGATNRDVLSVFLGEAAGIGLVGGAGGVLLGWSAGQIINVLAITYLSQQAAQQGGLPPSLAVYTPIWLMTFALLFATLMGLLSGLYPALRAATMVPVTALKYE